MKLTLEKVKYALGVVVVVAAVLLVLVLAFVIAVQRGASAQAGAALLSPADGTPSEWQVEPSTPAPSSSAKATPRALAVDNSPLAAYRGLASWVDVYDAPAWRDPSAAIDDMSRHGVRTLFVQTSHYNSAGPFFDEKGLREFIAEGHAHGMRVVAWYLPNMKPGSVDYQRVAAAVKLHTADGQTFDSFALDIESSAIHSEWARNRGLEALSAKIRTLVGPKYPLGAIIPAPVGLSRPHSVWGNFPYSMLPRYYDVFVPMGYYTFHGHSAKSAYADAAENLRILRAQPNCATVPVHLIGGLAEDSSNGQVQAFAQAVREGGCIGASLYGWAGTSHAAWRALASIDQ